MKRDKEVPLGTRFNNFQPPAPTLSSENMPHKNRMEVTHQIKKASKADARFKP